MQGFHGKPCIVLVLLWLACSEGPAVQPPPVVPSAGGLAPANVAGFSPTPTPTPTPMPAPAVQPSARMARVSLIDHQRWMQLVAADDPFEDRPADAHCAAEGIKAEELGQELVYGVDTGSCSYVTAQQPALQHVQVGETIRVRLWHFALNAPNPGEAHAAVDVGGQRVLEARVPIPAAGGLIKVEAPADRAITAGAPVQFHLHNHGDNSWALVEVTTGP